jgi:prepilin signal peptidase PulO-like enzyme (type II secretory pathway)
MELHLVIRAGSGVNLVWAAVGGAAGLVAGGLLRGTVFRLSVPAGAPDRAACPLGLVRPGQLGGGDIKLAGLAGLVLGWLGWPTVLFGAALGFVLAALASLVLLAARRITLRGAISFGPFLLAGALLVILAVGPAGTHFP